jgi:hypothetical protein
MSVSGMSVVLPSVLSLAEGGAVFYITNSGSVDIVVRDNTWHIVQIITAGQTYLYFLLDSTSRGGTWQAKGVSNSAALPAYLAGTPNTLQVQGSSYNRIVQLTPTKFVVVYRNNITTLINAQIVTLDAGMLTAGAVNVLTAENASWITAVSISANEIIISYTTTALNFKSFYLVVNDTTMYTGAALTTYAGLASNGTKSAIAMLSPTSFIVSYLQSGTGVVFANILTLSGTTLSAGAQFSVGTGPVPDSTLSLVGISPTLAAITYSDTTPTRYIRTLSVSGTTITANPAQSYSTNHPTTAATEMVLFSSTLLGTYYVNGSFVYVHPIAISGTSLTPGTETIIGSGSYTGWNSIVVTGGTNFMAVSQKPTAPYNILITSGTASSTVVTNVVSTADITASNSSFNGIVNPAPGTYVLVYSDNIDYTTALFVEAV